MAIIISRNGKGAQKVEPAAFENEDHLQQYIYDNPESLPLYEIDEDIRLFVIAREFPTLSGPIDALGIDGDGQIYVIETKLYKNPDKRLVLAQVLDYGASLWAFYNDFSQFVATLEDAVSKKFGMSLSDKLKAFFGITPDDLAVLMENCRTCLSEGRMRFVVLMDTLHDRLKDLIVFVNQNSQFNVYGVELEYYRHSEFEILIPRLFGAEVKKRTSAASGQRRRWDEASFFVEAENSLEAVALAAVRKLYEFSQANAEEIVWGTGAINGSFTGRFPTSISEAGGSLYGVYTNGDLFVTYFPMSNQEKAHFGKTSGLDRTANRYRGYRVDAWVSKVDRIIEALDTLIRNRTPSS